MQKGKKTTDTRTLLGTSASLLVTSALLVTRTLLGANGIATRNKCLTSSNKKLVVTAATLLVTSALLVTRTLLGTRGRYEWSFSTGPKWTWTLEVQRHGRDPLGLRPGRESDVRKRKRKRRRISVFLF